MKSHELNRPTISRTLPMTAVPGIAEKPGLIAQQEIDDAHSKDLVAEAQLAAANSSLAAAVQQVDVDQSSAARVQTMIDYERVTAPSRAS